MNIKSPSPQLSFQFEQPKLPLKSFEKTEDDAPKKSLIRDAATIGAGVGAGVAGGIYGFGEGLVKGGIKNYPAHVKGGAKIGKAALTPIGGACGAIATGVIVATVAVGSPVALVLSTTIGTVAGTLLSAAKHAPSSVMETGKKGAESGANAGQRFGKAGSVIGKYVGGALGGIAGIGVALGRGAPDGLAVGKREAKLGFDMIKGLPDTAKMAWCEMYPAGKQIGGSVGLLAGGSSGLVTASGASLVDGLTTSVKRGAEWGKAASDYVSGNKAEKPPQETTE